MLVFSLNILLELVLHKEYVFYIDSSNYYVFISNIWYWFKIFSVSIFINIYRKNLHKHISWGSSKFLNMSEDLETKKLV